MKTKYQQCSLSSFKTISTTHLAQGPLKTHNIKHRYCIYTTKTKEKKETLTTVCAVCCAITLSTFSSYIAFCHLLSVRNSKMFILYDTGIYTLGLLDQYSELVMYSKTCGAILSLWPCKCFSLRFTQHY